MKVKPALLLFFGLAAPLSAEDKAAPASSPSSPSSPPSADSPRDRSSDLAKPLRKYDANKDGKLTGDELRLARQAFNRGGKAPEMSADDWQGVLDYFKGDWRKRNFDKLDTNHDGKLDEAEKERVQTIWGEIAAQLTSTRVELVSKYDKNDDGNVTREERRDFDPEFNRRRREIETAVLEKHIHPPVPPEASPALPAAPPAAAQTAPPPSSGQAPSAPAQGQ